MQFRFWSGISLLTILFELRKGFLKFDVKIFFDKIKEAQSQSVSNIIISHASFCMPFHFKKNFGRALQIWIAIQASTHRHQFLFRLLLLSTYGDFSVSSGVNNSLSIGRETSVQIHPKIHFWTNRYRCFAWLTSIWKWNFILKFMVKSVLDMDVRDWECFQGK